MSGLYERLDSLYRGLGVEREHSPPRLDGEQLDMTDWQMSSNSERLDPLGQK